MRIKRAKIYKSEEALENWMWLELTTEDGVSGFGEISTSPKCGDALAKCVSAALEELVKTDISDDDAIRTLVFSACFGSPQPTAKMVLSGISQAVFDIRSKQVGLPLYKYLGGHKCEVKLYANINRVLRKNRVDQIMFANVEGALNAGFTRVKIAPLDKITPDCCDEEIIKCDIECAIKRIKQVASMVGGKNTAVDCHQRFNERSLKMFLDALSESGVSLEYVEDLLTYTVEHNAYINLIKSNYDFAFAAGETCVSVQEIKDVADCGCYSFFNPDVKFVGDLNDYREAYAYVKSRGGVIMPHNPTSPLATAVSAAIISAEDDDARLEIVFGNQQFRNEFVGGVEPVADGKYTLSDKCGIGVEPAEEFLKKYCYTFEKGDWVKIQ